MNNLIATIHRDYLPKNVLQENTILFLDVEKIDTFLTKVEFLPRD